MTYNLCIDIGGTTFSFAIFINKSKYFISKKYNIRKYNNVYFFLKDLVNYIEEKISQINITEKLKIGIACPGPLNSKTGEILNTPNLKFLQNVNLVSELKKLLNYEIKIENDANVYSLGAYNSLKIKSNVFIGITLGTGIGFGIIINGKLFKGSSGMAGEYEPSPLSNNLSWSELVGYKFFENQSLKSFNKNYTPKELYNFVETSEKNKNECSKIWEKYGYNIGLCLSHVTNMLNPDCISIGGGVSGARKYFHSSLIKSLKNNCHIYDENKIKILYDEENKYIYNGCIYI